MFRKMFYKKNIEFKKSDNKEKPLLGCLQLTSLGIGAIIGAGAFVIVGQGAADFAGPGLILSFFIAAIICFFMALCYAEFAALIPVSGGVYSYTYVVFGEFIAWIVGWGVILEFLSSPCIVSIGFSGYIVKILGDLGIILPKYLSSPVLGFDDQSGWYLTGSLINLPSMLIIGIMGVFVSLDVKKINFFNNIMVVIKMSLIFMVIILGISFIKIENLTPFIPENIGNFGQFGWSGVLRGVGIVFSSYIGFDSLATMSKEVKNPKKDITIGMVNSIIISLLVYVLMTLVVTGIVNYKYLSTPYPMALVIKALGPQFSWLSGIINICILVALVSVMLTMLLALSKITYKISIDGLIPNIFNKTNKNQTTFSNNIIITIVAAIISAIFPLSAMAQLTAMGAIIGFIFVCIGVIYLRVTQPNLERPFKTPFYPFTPLVGFISCIGLMCIMSKDVWQMFGIWMLTGIIIYVIYGLRNSSIKISKEFEDK